MIYLKIYIIREKIYENTIYKWISSKFSDEWSHNIFLSNHLWWKLQWWHKDNTIFIMHVLGLCINVDSYMTHMFYSWSFSHNTSVPIAISKKTYFLFLNKTLFYLLADMIILLKYNVTIRFINM